MKRLITLLSASILFVVLFQGCSTTLENKITIKNLAAGSVNMNFRASLVSVDSGNSTELKDVPKGTYGYETIYEIPTGTSSVVEEGPLSGEFILNAGTKILVVYTSNIDEEGVYTISVSITTSEDQTVETGDNLVGP